MGVWRVFRFSVFWKKFEINVCEGASAENVEIHHFSNFKTRFLSLWPENPTICDDIEMARYAVVCSTSLWGWEALKMSLYLISPLLEFSKNGAAQDSTCTIGG